MIKFAGIQMMVSACKNKNLAQAADLVSKAVTNGANLVCLPECFNCPYGTQYFEEYAETIPEGNSSKLLKDLAIQHKIYLIGGSFPELCGTSIYNTSCVYNPDGELIAKHRKVHLFDIDIPGKITFKESDVLSPGSNVTVFNVGELKVGLGICYDIRFPELAHLMKLRGADFIIYPGAFNMTTGPIFFELYNRARAADNQVYCASVAPARDTQASYVSWAHTHVVQPNGQVVAGTGEQEDIVYCDIDKNVIEEARLNMPMWKQRRSDIYNVFDVKKDVKNDEN